MKTLDQNEITRRMQNALCNVLFYTNELNRLPLNNPQKEIRAHHHREFCLHGLRHATHAETYAIVLDLDRKPVWQEIHASSIALEGMAISNIENPQLVELVENRMQRALKMIREVAANAETTAAAVAANANPHITQGMRFETSNATIEVVQPGQVFKNPITGHSQMLYLCRDMAGDDEIFWTAEQINDCLKKHRQPDVDMSDAENEWAFSAWRGE